MVNKSEHIEIPEVGCPRYANVKRQLEAEDARETRVFNGLFSGSMRRVCTYRVFNGFALFDHTGLGVLGKIITADEALVNRRSTLDSAARRPDC
jgi:hypothetical protein